MKLFYIAILYIVIFGCSKHSENLKTIEWQARALIGVPPAVEMECLFADTGLATFQFRAPIDEAAEWLYNWQPSRKNLIHVNYNEFLKDLKILLNTKSVCTVFIVQLDYVDRCETYRYQIEVIFSKVSDMEIECQIKVLKAY